MPSLATRNTKWVDAHPIPVLILSHNMISHSSGLIYIIAATARHLHTTAWRGGGLFGGAMPNIQREEINE